MKLNIYKISILLLTMMSGNQLFPMNKSNHDQDNKVDSSNQTSLNQLNPHEKEIFQKLLKKFNMENDGVELCKGDISTIAVTPQNGSKKVLIHNDFFTEFDFNENQIDAILGHELIHLKNKHSQKRQIFRCTLLSIIIASNSVGLISKYTKLFSSLKKPIINSKFNFLKNISLVLFLPIFQFYCKYQELEADREAAKILNDYDAPITFLSRYSKLDEDSRKNIFQKIIFLYTSDHPAIKTRIAQMEYLKTKMNKK